MRYGELFTSKMDSFLSAKCDECLIYLIILIRQQYVKNSNNVTQLYTFKGRTEGRLNKPCTIH